MKNLSVKWFLLIVATTIATFVAVGAGAGIDGATENERLIKVASFFAIVAFLIGALWARVLTGVEMLLKFSSPLPLIKERELHPFMCVGERYVMLTYVNLSRGHKGRLYLLQSEKNPLNVFCALAHSDFRLPNYFQVTRKTRIIGSPSFAFEQV
jgi:hypothetical protein